MKNPCYKCPDRTETCHSSCWEYEIYCKDLQEKKDLIRKNKAKEQLADDVMVGSYCRATRKKIKGKC